MFCGLCLKADARRFVYVINELLVVWIATLAVYWLLRDR